MSYVHLVVVISFIGAFELPLRADDAKKEKPGVASPEQTVLLLLAPITESSLLYAGYHVSSADRPWWSKVWFLDIAEDEEARIRKEFEAAPARLSTGVVYECQAKWILHGWEPIVHWQPVFRRTLEITSPPKRLQVEGDSWTRAKITGSKLTHQPGHWAGKPGDKRPYPFRSFLWLLENKNKELTDEHERLTTELKGAKVPSKEVALALAAKDSPKFARERVQQVILDRAVADQPGFKRGDLIWGIVCDVAGPDRKTAGRLECFINARTAAAVSNTNVTPRSLAKYLVNSHDDLQRSEESTNRDRKAPSEEGKSYLPKVERDYTSLLRAGDSPGKTFAELIPPRTIRRIILTRDHVFSDLEKHAKLPNADVLFARLLESPAKAMEWGLSATERDVAEFIIVTEKNDIFRVVILCQLGERMTAFLLYAKGYTCRFVIDAAIR